MASGFVQGGGNALLQNGNIYSFFTGATTGLLMGGFSGAITGFAIGYFTAKIDGCNPLTGERYDVLRHRVIATTPDDIPTQVSPESQPINANIRHTQEGHVYELNIESHFIDSYGNTLVDGSKYSTFERPMFKGYNENALYGKIDTYHDFPRDFDEHIVKFGCMKMSSSGTGMIAPGWVDGVPGYYHINFNSQSGLIYHRMFYPLDKARQIRVDDVPFFLKP